MKLTKAQRLFIKAGEAQCRIKQYKYNIVCYDRQDHSDTIAYYKKKRKQYIRRALEAARSENTAHYMNGINEILRLIERKHT